jgi:membrane fusion protein (multidrug efflux system)
LSEVTVDATTGSVLVRALFPNPDGLLLPGMYVRALVIEGQTDQGMLVPQQALSRDRKGNAAVRIVNAAGKLEMRTLSVARAIDGDWLVTDGLAEGDRVVIEGASSAPPGASVEIVAAGQLPAGGKPVAAKRAP